MEARAELRTELRTPAREIQRHSAGGCEREQRELEMCHAAATPTRSLTHSSSYPNGPAKGGPNSLARPNYPSPKLVVRSENMARNS